MMKKEAKAIALQVIMESLGVAYYKICDGAIGFEGYTEDEQELIIKYINKYGQRIAKTLNTEYYTF